MGCPYYSGEKQISGILLMITCAGEQRYIQTGICRHESEAHFQCEIYIKEEEKRMSQCPYFKEVKIEGKRKLISCENVSFSYENMEAFEAKLKTCTESESERELCRPFLYRQCEENGLNPQSFHSLEELHEMYSKIKEEKNMSTEITAQSTEVSEEFLTAKQVHAEAIANVAIIGNAYVTMSKALKRMRDEKLYTQLGYETFDEYVDSNYPFKARQAYSYISTLETYGEQFLQSNANLGVTKLEMLKPIFAPDRKQFMEENDVEGMSTRELKEAIEKITKQGEQISLLTEENERLKADSAEEEQLEKNAELFKSERDKAIEAKNRTDGKLKKLENELSEVKEAKKKAEIALKEFESRPLDVAVVEPSLEQMEEFRIEAEKKAKQEALFLEQLEEFRIEAEKKAKQEILLEKEKEIEELKAAAAESETLKKKLAAAQNDKVKEFRIYFEDTKSRLEKLFSVLAEIDDEEMKKKLTAAAIGFLDAIRNDLGGV